MLRILNAVDEETIDRLFAVYRQSMEDLSGRFEDGRIMRREYARFLAEFIREPGRLAAVEEEQGRWASALRAIETAPGAWFLEALETDPELRGRGHARRLLNNVAEYVSRRGGRQLACLIRRTNQASIAAHRACGFQPTDKAPVNWDGEPDEESVRFECDLTCGKGGDGDASDHEGPGTSGSQL